MSRVKREYRTTSRENYDRFMKDNNISEDKLSYSKYEKVIDTNNWMFMEYILETGDKIRLPHGFGDLSINKKMLKKFKEHEGKRYINLRIDWAKTKKEGKKIYHTNEHSDGFNYRWIWFTTSALIHLNKLYVFRPCRYASRRIAQYIKKTGSQYKQLYNEYVK